ncbi:MAG: nitrogen fixation protein NifM [Methylovulum sp.]|uniref:nitrogen fixation protein NifM n=1 Tax=Methylovulum sp. TaxID=1916980 RepID=UPI00260D48A2|nr:nitrogen fixation protein NifM [Methylovulum sp.]MDD2722891.1 nitrogen fixation protein NifM [Methylovulum sp.]MDD5125038.1 nitrogen fixation protein NifM [Methylovulum sp.]
MTPTTNPSKPEAYNVLRAALALFKKAPSELADAQLTEAQRQAANEYKIETRVLNSPEATAVMVPDEEVERAYQEIRGRYEDETVFLSELYKNHLDEDALRAALYRQCKVNTVLERVGSRAPDASEIEVGIYYHLHPEQFQKPEMREAGHIFISINPEYPENTREMARERLEEISAKLQKKPHKFAGLALKHSECPTALQGGVLGLVPSGKLYPELDAVLFKLKAGEISGIVESEIGFHLVLCKQIQKPESLSLQKATPKIRQFMKERAKRTCQRAWIAGLTKE